MPIPRKRIIELVCGVFTSDTIAVATLGSASYYLYEVGDRPRNLYTFGAMGQASSIALGLSLAQPNIDVVIIDGDGSLLMNLSILATIAREAPQRLLHVVLDDGAYESTGGQPTATAGALQLDGVARACGIPRSLRISTEADLDAALERWRYEGGPMFVDVHALTERGRIRPRYDPTFFKYRLRDSFAGVLPDEGSG